MYSAASSSSSIVPESPRFNNTGRRTSPTAERSAKFCMFRAPICNMSACSATTSTCRVSMTSVTIGSPVSARTSASKASASSPNPRNAYGDERGLYAPPRKSVAPAARTDAAALNNISRPSTEHGPAITASSFPPIAAPAPSPTTTMVGSARNSRATCRYGLSTGMTFSTPARVARPTSASIRSSPIHPTIVRCSPREVCLKSGALDGFSDGVEFGVGDVWAGDNNHWGFA